MENCIFCKIVQKTLPAEIIEESKNILVIKDINQKVPGHSLAITKKHYPYFLDIPKEEYQELLETTNKALTKIIKQHNTKEYNMAVVGEMIPHFHLHLIPRTPNDGFNIGL